MAKSRGKRGSIRLLGVREVRPPAEVATALDLGETGTAFLRHQILSYDDEPVELVKSYCPAELARGTALAEPRKIRGGTPALLAEMGYPPIQTVDRVSVRVPTQEQYEALRLPGDLPILRTFRVVYSTGECPIEATSSSSNMSSSEQCMTRRRILIA